MKFEAYADNDDDEYVVVVVDDDDDDGQRVRRPLPCTNDVSGLGAPPPPAVSLLIVGVR